MSGLAALVGHSLRRRRGLLAAISLMLVVFQWFMILTARNFEQSGGFRQIAALMPAFMAQWTNMMAASFTGFVLFGYSHPLVQLFLVAMAISIGIEPVGEIETRFVDLTMARPLGRTTAINRTLIVLAVSTAIAVGSMLVATFSGLRLLTPAAVRAPQPSVIVSLAANLALLVLVWGGIALAIAACARRRATAGAATGFLAFATFVLDYVGRFWAAVKPFSRISPFHYFDPFAMIGGRGLVTSDVVTLLAMFAASAAIASAAYAWRDL